MRTSAHTTPRIQVRTFPQATGGFSKQSTPIWISLSIASNIDTQEQVSEDATDDGPLSSEERTLLLKEQGLTWENIANRLESDSGVTYSMWQLMLRYNKRRAKLQPEAEGGGGVVDTY